MTDDPQDPNQPDDDGGGGGRPNFPGIGSGLLPILLSLFKGKGIIVLLILGAAAYFFLGRGFSQGFFVRKTSS